MRLLTLDELDAVSGGELPDGVVPIDSDPDDGDGGGYGGGGGYGDGGGDPGLTGSPDSSPPPTTSTPPLTPPTSNPTPPQYPNPSPPPLPTSTINGPKIPIGGGATFQPNIISDKNGNPIGGGGTVVIRW